MVLQLQHVGTNIKTFPLSCMFASLCLSGVFCSGGSGDDGGEPSGCAAADSAVHHEQVSLSGDVQRTTLSPVHCRDNGMLPLHVPLWHAIKTSSSYFELINLFFVQGEYVSCLLSLLRQMTELHFHHLLNNFHSKEELKVGKLFESQSMITAFCISLLPTYLDCINFLNTFLGRSSCWRSSACSAIWWNWRSSPETGASWGF